MKFHKLEQSSGSGEGSKTFLTIKDGESVNAVFRGEIHEFYTKWIEGKSQLVGADDPEGKLRFRVNAIVKEGSQFVAKIWEFGRPVYDQLSEINAEYPLETIKVKVSRRGVKLETTYMILPLLGDKDKLSGEAIHVIGLVPLNILEHKPPQAPPGIREHETLNEYGF